MPRLNCSSAQAKSARGRFSSASTLAKPKPWIRPKKKATTTRRTGKIGSTLSSAASTIVTAIAGSMNAGVSDTSFSAARPSVIECATVNAGDDADDRPHRLASRSTGCQPARRPPHHRRQQQAEQEEDVVVAGQDVAHAFDEELPARALRLGTRRRPTTPVALGRHAGAARSAAADARPRRGRLEHRQHRPPALARCTLAMPRWVGSTSREERRTRSAGVRGQRARRRAAAAPRRRRRCGARARARRPRAGSLRSPAAASHTPRCAAMRRAPRPR